MRAAKREILRLLSTFVEKCGEPEAPPRLVAESFVPPLLEPVLEDYAQAVPAARDSDALLLLGHHDRQAARARVRTSPSRTGSRLRADAPDDHHKFRGLPGA